VKNHWNWSIHTRCGNFFRQSPDGDQMLDFLPIYVRIVIKMKLVYSNRRFNQILEIHRFDALGDFTDHDLSVLEESVSRILNRPLASERESIALIIDLSESSASEPLSLIRAFESRIRDQSLAHSATFFLALTEIESFEAESTVIEKALEMKISRMKSRIDLMESIRRQISLLETENLELRTRMTDDEPAKPLRKASFFDRFWGDI